MHGAYVRRIAITTTDLGSKEALGFRKAKGNEKMEPIYDCNSANGVETDSLRIIRDVACRLIAAVILIAVPIMLYLTHAASAI